MRTVIRSVRLPLDPGQGEVDVTLEDGLIADVRPTGAAATDARVVDGAGKHLVPGLVDTHLHLTGRHNLTDLARAGVTTGVDLGTHPDSLVQSLRSVPGMATIVSAGSAASALGSTQTTVMGFPAESVVQDAADAARFVRWRMDHGSDLIKIIVEDPHNPGVRALPPETLTAIVEAAHAQGLQTIGHAVTAHSFDLALDAGIDVITHAPADRGLTPAQVERLAAQGTIVCPTLIMMRTVIDRRAGQPGPPLSFDACVESVRALHQAGVPVLAGTDANETPIAPVPHGSSLHDELELLVDAGLSVREAIDAATAEAARVLSLDDRGRIAPGLRADLALLDGDPTADLSAWRRPGQVWIAGQPRVES